MTVHRLPSALSRNRSAASESRKGSVQLRLRLRLVPVRPRRDVLQLRLEEIVQELLLRVLHLREDLARSRRADAVDRVRIHGPLPVNRDEIRDLLRAGEQFSFLVREVKL